MTRLADRIVAELADGPLTVRRLSRCGPTSAVRDLVAVLLRQGVVIRVDRLDLDAGRFHVNDNAVVGLAASKDEEHEPDSGVGG